MLFILRPGADFPDSLFSSAPVPFRPCLRFISILIRHEQLDSPAGLSKLVAAFDEQPLPPTFTHPYEIELALQLVPVQTEIEPAPFKLSERVFARREFVAPLVPDHVLARAVIAFWDVALKFQILYGVIFGRHGEAFVRRVERWAFGHRP